MQQFNINAYFLRMKKLNPKSICSLVQLSFAFFIHKDALTQNDFWLHFFSETTINTRRSWPHSKQSSLSSKQKDNNPKTQLLKKIGRKQPCHQNLEAKAIITTAAAARRGQRCHKTSPSSGGAQHQAANKAKLGSKPCLRILNRLHLCSWAFLYLHTPGISGKIPSQFPIRALQPLLIVKTSAPFWHVAFSHPCEINSWTMTVQIQNQFLPG